MTYLALLRGINVGGNNKIPMSELKQCLTDLGYDNVITYIASGNIIFNSSQDAKTVTEQIQQILPSKFKLNSSSIKVLVITRDKLKKVIEQAPAGFGAHTDRYHSDVAFLIDKSSKEAFSQVETNPKVDKAWAGPDVIYYQRLSAELSKSRLSKIAGKPIYKYMTIRTWNTVNKLLKLMSD